MSSSRRRLLVAVDFDGTIVTENYPAIGEEIPGALGTIQALQKNGHKVFLYTMRGHPRNQEQRDTLQEAIDWLESRGVVMDGINRSPEQFSTSLKQFANVYIDDRNFGAPSRYWNGLEVFDWQEVATWFLRIEAITPSDFIGIFKNF